LHFRLHFQNLRNPLQTGPCCTCYTCCTSKSPRRARRGEKTFRSPSPSLWFPPIFVVLKSLGESATFRNLADVRCEVDLPISSKSPLSLSRPHLSRLRNFPAFSVCSVCSCEICVHPCVGTSGSESVVAFPPRSSTKFDQIRLTIFPLCVPPSLDFPLPPDTRHSLQDSGPWNRPGFCFDNKRNLINLSRSGKQRRVWGATEGSTGAEHSDIFNPWQMAFLLQLLNE
jgi:hypothetical protein